ncbi:hypothetical protein I79_003446 [Cricetulus griseus]|uniref:Uncharacterized protein n=1 Tax=Cricetulus griseus TaxID=10029 RepID=G3GZZ8_CRIGR|nr:hypothetical protein I79_003446 [Cricetulus griseus]
MKESDGVTIYSKAKSALHSRQNKAATPLQVQLLHCCLIPVGDEEPQPGCEWLIASSSIFQENALPSGLCPLLGSHTPQCNSVP